MERDFGKELIDAFNVGYAQGKADAEAYLLHCGDEMPVTNADRIRSMTDEELADWLWWNNDLYSRVGMDLLDWLKQEAE